MEQREFRQLMRDYFSFTRSERRGMVVLCVVLVLSVVVNLLSGIIRTGKPADPSEFMKRVQMMDLPAHEAVPRLTLFPFDPNRITEEELDSLDLPAPVKRNLLRYRQKGGSFRKAADFGRLYGMNDSLMAEITPYLAIPSSVRPSYSEKREYPRREYLAADSGRADREVRKYGYPERTPVMVELNSADSAMLLGLPGIGPAFAGRIIRYRNILGGFISPRQLLEVYGMTQERMVQFLPYVTADSSLIKSIRLNFADTRTLARHPYLGREPASRIVDFRSANGPFASPRQLLDHQLVDGEHFEKIVPYLTCR